MATRRPAGPQARRLAGPHRSMGDVGTRLILGCERGTVVRCEGDQLVADLDPSLFGQGERSFSHQELAEQATARPIVYQRPLFPTQPFTVPPLPPHIVASNCGCHSADEEGGQALSHYCVAGQDETESALYERQCEAVAVTVGLAFRSCVLAVRVQHTGPYQLWQQKVRLITPSPDFFADAKTADVRAVLGVGEHRRRMVRGGGQVYGLHSVPRNLGQPLGPLAHPVFNSEGPAAAVADPHHVIVVRREVQDYVPCLGVGDR